MVLKNICLAIFLQNVIKGSVAEFILKFRAFKIFFWIPLDGYVWSMRIILWYASYFGHSNNIHTPKPHCKNFWWNYNKNDTCTRNLGNKEQNLLFLVASQSDVHIEFDFASVSLRARSVFQIKFPRKIGRKEINLFSPEVVLWKKYVFLKMSLQNFHVSNRSSKQSLLPKTKEPGRKLKL